MNASSPEEGIFILIIYRETVLITLDKLSHSEADRATFSDLMLR